MLLGMCNSLLVRLISQTIVSHGCRHCFALRGGMYGTFAIRVSSVSPADPALRREPLLRSHHCCMACSLAVRQIWGLGADGTETGEKHHGKLKIGIAH
jgi:hypothetical protein